MKIILLGYGKMGKEVEKISLNRGHEILVKKNNKKNINKSFYLRADVAIDFSTPDSAFNNISTALNNNVPVISGTTGWLKDLEKIKNITQTNNTAFMHSSNFSIGVNLFYKLNKKLSKLMNDQTQYKATLREIHHANKIDKPSGTAINLAKNLPKNINIKSERKGEIYGTHIIKYISENDTIEIKHEAHNRKGFAFGAVFAAEWILNKKGFFNIEDIL